MREDSDIKEAYILGASSYVVKPVDFDAFLAAMSQSRTVLAARESTAS